MVPEPCRGSGWSRRTFVAYHLSDASLRPLALFGGRQQTEQGADWERWVAPNGVQLPSAWLSCSYRLGRPRPLVFVLVGAVWTVR
jgi:hypothetical protein